SSAWCWRTSPAARRAIAGMSVRVADRIIVGSSCGICGLYHARDPGRPIHVIVVRMETLETTCPLDCPDTCALEVTVDEGRITSTAGSAEDSLTAGYICSKVRRFPRRLYGADRVLYPLRRSGPKGSGRFERIGWDEALSSIARRLSE